MPKRMISVIGGADSDNNALEIAEQLGAEIAKRGAVLVCGGMGGVMEAACRGAKTQGGLTLGLIPSLEKEHGNEFLDITIPTGLGYARNFLVARTGDAVIAISGSAGTLSEIAIAWFSDKPLIALANTGGWAAELAGKKLDNRRSDEIFSASTPEEAVEIAYRELGWE
jgi:uncharacterized protein (TIGR00725 family)